MKCMQPSLRPKKLLLLAEIMDSHRIFIHGKVLSFFMVPVSITKGLSLSFLVRASAPIESESEMDQIFPAVKKLIKKPRSQKKAKWLATPWHLILQSFVSFSCHQSHTIMSSSFLVDERHGHVLGARSQVLRQFRICSQTRGFHNFLATFIFSSQPLQHLGMS